MPSIWYRLENDVVAADRWLVHPDAPAGGSGPGSARLPGPLRDLLPILALGLDSPAIAYVAWTEFAAAEELKARVEAVVEAVKLALEILWRDIQRKLRINYTDDLFLLLLAVLKFARDLAFKLAIPTLAVTAVLELLAVFAPEIALPVAMVLALAKFDSFAEVAYTIDLEFQALWSAKDLLQETFALGQGIGQGLLRIGRGASEAWGTPANPGPRSQRIHLAAKDIAAGAEVLLTDLLMIAVEIVMASHDPRDTATNQISTLASDVGAPGDELKQRLTSFVKKNARHLLVPRN